MSSVTVTTVTDAAAAAAADAATAAATAAAADRYKAHDVELDTSLKCFVPDYIPTVGEMDAFVKVPRPDGQVSVYSIHTTLQFIQLYTHYCYCAHMHQPYFY
jgi:Intraflagellar transport complex B protein 46 C terminal